MRTRYTAQQREHLIEAVRTSGEPVRAVAERMGVSASAAYLWMKAARPTKRPQFARLVPEPPTSAVPSLILRVGGAAIRVDPGFDAELLRSVVSALTARTA
jgi:transposase-like protein